ncbi:MAG TPA: hypothetical protein VIG08_02050 [Gemmatimonadales bacterium]|jgi:Tol biopolymer transport system component
MQSLSRVDHLVLVLIVSGVAGACGGGGSDLTEPTTGTLHITTSTSGAELDPDGYIVQIDAGPTQAITISGELSVTADSGGHAIRLDGVAANCTVSGDNPRSVTVADDQTTEVAFAIACAATLPGTGSAAVTTATTGTLLDPDGYALSVDGGQSQPIGSNATLAVQSLSVGSHSAALSGVASNCSADAAEQTFQVTAGASTPVTFNVVCAATRIAFSSNAPGLQAVFVVNPDGTGIKNLTPDGTFESTPVWSPDGTKLLFSMEDGLHVMNADGSDAHRIAGNDVGVIEYRWSPNGASIAFVALVRDGADVFGDLWVMNADGTNNKMLAPKSEQPTWAPDSRRIAYASTSDLLDMHIRMINSDGTGDVRITPEGTQAFQPDWSPDGTQIAFVTLGENDILLINPDGSGVVNLTQGQAEDDSPTWSPDGSRIAFNTGTLTEPLESEVAVMNRDGNGRTSLSNLSGFDFGPSWSPDGSGLVFTSSVDGNSEIYVMNADGSGQKNLSQRPDAEDTEGDWSGRNPGTQTAFGVRVAKRRWQLELCGGRTRC